MKGVITGGWFFSTMREGVYNENSLLHAKRLGLYMSKKQSIIKGSYSVEFSGYDGNNFVSKLVDNRVFDEPINNYEIGLQGLNFNFFGVDKLGGGR